MANWKDIGVVPDSEDEEDLDFSHGLTRSNDLQNEQQDLWGDNQTFDHVGYERNADRKHEHHNDLDESISVESKASPSPARPLPTITQEPRLSQPRIVGDPGPSWSPPIFPRSFNAPPELPGHDTQPGREGTGQAQVSNIILDELFEGDDISRSYVQITSSNESPLSSPPTSQDSALGEAHHSASGELSHPSSPRGFILQHASSAGGGDLRSLARRSLRERNPIQLHPYMLEQEKYRRTLKARGMTPMRLASTQNGRQSESLDVPFTNADIQDVEVDAGHSQSMDVDWELNVSSPPQESFSTANHEDAVHDTHTLSNDDEFPDVGELLEMPKTGWRDAELRRYRKSYSSKHKQFQRSKFQNHLPRSTSRKEASADLLNILASPPATSSPLMPPSHDSREGVLHTLSASPKGNETRILPGEDQLGFQVPADLLTPATSAVKPGTNTPLIIHSDTDIDDPFASESEMHSSASSDEFVQIRKVVKKIRGVLPASHLRIGQPYHKSKTPGYARDDNTEADSSEPLNRRGIAVSRPPGTGQRSPMFDSGEVAFLSSDSDEGDNDVYSKGFAAEDSSHTKLDELFDSQRQGFAEEEDSVDAMLPSRKRQSGDVNMHHQKRRRLGSVLSSKNSRATARQPRITEHLEKASKPYKARRIRQIEDEDASTRPFYGVSKRARNTAPRLSIIDVTHLDGDESEQLPQFIRIAARTARSRSGKGKQSPSKKFVKLANREDTLDAQSVLEDWRQGKIRPKTIRTNHSGSANISRPPLHRIANNRQEKLPLSTQNRRHPPVAHSQQVRAPRTILISKTRQSSINNFVSMNARVSQPSISPTVKPGDQNILKARPDRPRQSAPRIRPAQLEVHETEVPFWNPASDFISTKKPLEALYRTSRERRAATANPQLDRSFYNESSAHSTVRPPENTSSRTIDLTKSPTRKNFRRKKALPLQVDVGATKYRQPSEPLVLEGISPHVRSMQDTSNTLQGLGKYGTKYPIHFDIFPLHPETYFHDSTFIGSGLLAEVLESAGLHPNPTGPRISLRLDTKDFQWDTWNETVSSEIGMCFDWVTDQQLLQHPSEFSLPTTNPISVVTFIIDYVQRHLKFLQPCDRKDFLRRMSGIFQDFLLRLGSDDNIAQQKRTHWAGFLVRCTVLAFQLLRISRHMPGEASLGSEFEECIKSLAHSAARLLVSHGLDSIRKLYDDVQYLSFREHGIKSDQHIVQSWVVLMKVLDAAQLPKSSFWDTANRVLIDLNLPHVNDARVFEQLWYSIFSLLPLCEFDRFGIVKPGLRHKAAFHNWPFAQRILKRIFELYSLNPKQSPGFNDYCRATLNRCLYLMTEWGWWKCTGLIGTIFDFFASHKLAHLRNEEVYSSPRFLMELDKTPSLAAEPEDRCFHIFLKIVGSAIKHMREEQNAKSIRNLVARLLPNHDRRYPKEEAIHHRELASLRNHHDLLCTLYWAAPAEQRPSTSLIQDLVVADRSHNEACLINLRAWENLTRFIVTNSTDVSMYRPFEIWQNSFSASLSRQYLETESEVRHQVEILATTAKNPIFERQLQDTIVANKRSTMEILRAIVKAMDHTVRAAMSTQMAIQTLNPQLLSLVLLPDLLEDPNFQEGVLRGCIEVISHYMEQIDRLQPMAPLTDQTTCCTEGESQGSLDMNLSLDRVELIYRLQPEILPLLRVIISKGLQDGLSIPHTLLYDLVLCWARLAVKFMEGAMNLKEFLVSGPNALFQQRQVSRTANAYWPLFLSELLEHQSLENFKIPHFNIGLEWLKVLSMPQDQVSAIKDKVYALTAKLQSKGYYLTLPSQQSGSGAISSQTAFDAGGYSHHALIKNAVDVMRATLYNQPSFDTSLRDIPQKEAHGIFAAMLKDVMDSIKHHLEFMTPGSECHRQYVEFVQPIICVIRSHGSDIQPLLEFFVHSSVYYWPEDTDPNLYAAGIVSYSLRLIKQPGRTSPELFHYLYNGWRKDIAQATIGRHVRYVKKGMSCWEFTFFLLSEFMPAALHVGFESAAGWALCATYLPALSRRAGALLQKRETTTDITFQYVVNMLKIILNGLIGLQYRAGNPGFKSLEYITHAVSQFWFSLVLPLNQYADPYPEKAASIRSLGTALTKLICYASRLRDTDSDSDNPIVDRVQVNTGGNFEKFVSVLTKDIRDNWEVNDDKSELVIVGTRGREKTRTVVNVKSLLGESQTLRQMLDAASPYLEYLVDVSLPTDMQRRSSWDTQDSYF